MFNRCPPRQRTWSAGLRVRRANHLVQEPAIGLIKWFRPKGLKVCSYVEKCAEFKNLTLKKSAGTQKCYVQRNTPGKAISQNSAKMGVSF